ncbi:hypothetical protein IGI37_003780 [Enterococcus sp. AZ194]|uniref:sensor histidine kinase n=1 Tax=Enterococcus sp. AZ194 TaxID=2774629 RepID=UPI003F1EE9AE
MTNLVIGVLLLISVISIFRLVQYRLQLKKINEQLLFVQKHESNMLLTSQMDNRLFNQLIILLNQELVQHKEEKVQLILKEQAIKETITNLAHDIRTPLTSLDGYFQLLVTSQDHEKQDVYVANIKNRITTLTEMLEAIFTYTKLQNDDYDLQMSEVQINQILFATLFTYYPILSEKNIEPELNISDEPIIIEGEETAITRIFSNVLKNSLEHGAGDIKVSLQKEDKQVVFSCQNAIQSGDSLDEAKLFDRFYMSDLSRTGHSTGLGLVIAKELVKKMQGTIELMIDEKTFTVIVLFPCID